MKRSPLSRGFRRALCALSILLPLLGLLADCGLFDLRNPASSGGQGEVPWDTPTEPRIALANLKTATEARAIGNYERSLTTDYVFRFDPYDVAADTVWHRDKELAGMGALFNNEATVRLTWTVRDSGHIGENRYYRNLGYRLVFRRSASDSVVIVGLSVMYFKMDGVQWLIYRWADVKDTNQPNLPSWGYARLNPSLKSP